MLKTREVRIFVDVLQIKVSRMSVFYRADAARLD